MLKSRTLTQILCEVNTPGKTGTLLFNKDGRLIAFTGYSDKELRMIAAIASGIWASYSNYGKNVLADSQLEHVIIEAERGIALLSIVSDIIICVYSRDCSLKSDIGMLKLKMMALIEHISEPLSKLSGI